LPVIGGVIAVFVLQTTYLNQFMGLSMGSLIGMVSVFGILLVLFTLVTVQVLNYYTPQKNKYAFALIESLVIACIHVLLARYIVIHNFDFSVTQIYNFSLLLPHQLTMSFLIIATISMFSLRGNKHVQKTQVEIREMNATEILREAELNKLQQQLQPHFLFNSLNSINALIIISPDEAREMIQKLSDFLRTTLKRADEQWVEFKHELDYLQLYLDIEKIRFGHRLEIKTIVDPNTLEQKIPTLLLQPIIENAIKFGLYGTTQNVIIEFNAKVESNMMVMTIRNPFDNEMLPQKGTGFGLTGIKRRLYLLYARNDLLETNANENVFTTILKTPLKND